ncbi:MAG: hypothetical protein R6W73_05470 [Candidatus Saliniplasma sp.]
MSSWISLTQSPISNNMTMVLEEIDIVIRVIYDDYLDLPKETSMKVSRNHLNVLDDPGP